METQQRHRRDNELRDNQYLLTSIAETSHHFNRLQLFEPSLAFKYLSTKWLAALTGISHKNTLTATRLLRDSGYLEYLDPAKYKQIRYLSKPNLYTLTEKGKSELQRLNTPMLPYSHRSNSFPHELMTDLAWNAPLRLLALRDPSFKLATGYDILQHPLTPTHTKKSQHPFSLFLWEKDDTKKYRLFDSPPFRLAYENRSIFIPGIETDRAEKNYKTNINRTSLGNHIEEILYCLEHKKFQSRYGIENERSLLFPILFSSKEKMNTFKAYMLERHGERPEFLFNWHPDFTELEFYPAPSTDLITTPWTRLGTLKPYSLHQLKEV